METIRVGTDHPAGCDCDADNCPTSGGVFYVVATRGREEFEIAGPIDTFWQAVELMPQAWLYFWKLNPKNPYKWSVAKRLGDSPPASGLLNERLGVRSSLAENRGE